MVAFTNAMLGAFKPAIVVKEAHQQILNLCRTGHLAGYVWQFCELLYKIPTMVEEESYMLFVRCLKPDVKASVGVNVPEGVEDEKGSWVILLANLACLLVTRLWLYRRPHHRMLVAKERKEGLMGKKKADNCGNMGTKGHPKATHQMFYLW